VDIPLLTDNNGDLLKTTTQGMTMYNFSTKLSFQQVLDFYKVGMDTNSWQVMSSTTQTGMQMWNFTKGNGRQVMIAITGESSGPVQVSIILQ